MSSIPIWAQILIFSFIGSVGTIWLFTTIDVMFRYRSKKFEKIWLLLNAILIIILMIIVVRLET